MSRLALACRRAGACKLYVLAYTATLAVIATMFTIAPAASAFTRALKVSRGGEARLVNTSAHHRPATAPRIAPLRPRNVAGYAAAKAAAQADYSAWLQRHPSAGARIGTPSKSTPRVFSSSPYAVLFENLNQPGILGGQESTGITTDVTPPDTTGAIGPSNYVEFVNSQIAVYGRSLGAPLSEMTEDAFTGSSGTCDGQIRWDQQAERWEYVSLDCATKPPAEQGFSFGWSKTSDPTDLTRAGWCKYHFPTGSVLADYPKLGGDDEFMIVGTNGYEFPSEKYVGSTVYVVPKPPKGSSACPEPLKIYFEGGFPFTPVPANISGSSLNGYIVASQYEETGAAEHIALFTLTGSAGVPESVIEEPITVGSYFMPPGVPQPIPSTDLIDSSDTRLTQAVAAEDPSLHKFAVWTQHTVSRAPGTPSVVRWYELTAGSSTPTQEGTVAAATTGSYAFNAAISPTTRGNGAAIDYNEGGPNQEVELHAKSRGPAMTSGAMEEDVKLATSEGIDDDFSCPSVTLKTQPCRWGDYAGASPDPLHPGVVWGTGEFNGKPDTSEHHARWKTENFALVLHAPPGASIKVTTASPIGGSPVSFEGFSGEDPVEPIAAYEWSFGDGSSGSGRTVSHVYSRPGKYLVTLTVMDDGGVTSTAKETVTVADAPPVASLAAPSPTATVPATFDGSASHDPDGSIESYEWSFGDGSPPATGASPTHTYAHAGKYTVKLTVTDNSHLTDSVEHEVTVADAAPIASFSATTTLPIAGTPVGFNGTGSSDADGSVTAYSWSFGDSTSGSGPAPSHVYTKAGSYAVKLTVTDNGGLTASTEQTIAVGPEPNVFAVVAVKPNKRNGSVALSVRFFGPGLFTAVDAATTTGKTTLLTRLAHIFGFADPSAEAAKKGKPKHKPKRKPALVKSVRLAVAGAGIVTIQMALTSAGKAELIRHHGKLTVKLSLMFAPTYGSPARKTQVIRPAIVKPRGKKKRK